MSNPLYHVYLVLSMLIFLFLLPFQASSGALNQGTAFEIRNLLEGDESQLKMEYLGGRIYSRSYLLTFYSERAFMPGWLTGSTPSCEALELRLLIQQSKFDGLIPEDYHLDQLNILFEKSLNGTSVNERDLALMDILLSDAFILLAKHLYQGKVHPEHLKGIWDIQSKENDPKLLEKLNLALARQDVRQQLFSLHPKFPIYQRMRHSLKKYHEMEQTGSGLLWNNPEPEKPLEPGQRAEQVPAIRDILVFWKDLENYAPDTNRIDVYDSLMAEGVKRFQLRHGLQPDGKLGKATIQALNQSPRTLIEKAMVNMERLRWLPDTTLQELILVNIANYSMDYIRARDTLLHSNAIVGQSYRKTPVFNAELSYLVFNPTWTVPPTILKNDVIPAVKKDIGYLARKNMKILDFSGKEIDPNTINWAGISSDSFPYMVRQASGRQNSLGLVKFMFPNKYNVYIHDTPSRELFFRADRALSSGCIRIQKPLELAQILLADQPLWTEERIKDTMNGGKEQPVASKKKIPVIILYLTFWTDGANRENIRRDIYSRDGDLLKLLKLPLTYEN